MAGNLAISVGDSLSIEASALGKLFDTLKKAQYVIYGPTVRDNAIVYDLIEGIPSLPAGITDEQEAATYRLKSRKDSALFGYRVSPQSFKQYLSPPTRTLWKASRHGKSFEFSHSSEEVVRQAFVGMRPCDLSALKIQDRIMTQDVYGDDDYRRRRENTFVVAVNCTEVGHTCFCTSMGTGPRAVDGFDLCLTEIITNDSHRFLIQVGSEAGIEVAGALPCDRADEDTVDRVNALLTEAAAQMGRSIDIIGLKDLVSRNLDNVYWYEVGRLCLSCCSCTLVCPTCFCFAIEDTTDLKGENATRVRRWDSCFTADFSYIHGGSVRPSTMARYRQWASHKLGHWHDQFGTSGCVGCGRCITWCPAGIDITEVAQGLRDHDLKARDASHEKEVKNANT